MNKPVWVIKIGGAILDNQAQGQALFDALLTLQKDYALVLVHGGGNMVQQWLQQLNFTSEKVNGLRVTPSEQLPFVVGALAGTANKQLCATALATGLNAVGLSLMDGGLSQCIQMDAKLGAVGKAKPKQAKLLVQLLQQGYLPVVSSIGADDKGGLFNVNADQAATVIAQLLGANLMMLSDVDGVLDGSGQLLPSLSPKSIKQLVKQQVIRDGMLVKVNAALTAAQCLQKPVTIASWKQPQALCELAKGQSVGSKIYPMEEL